MTPSSLRETFEKVGLYPDTILEICRENNFDESQFDDPPILGDLVDVARVNKSKQLTECCRLASTVKKAVAVPQRKSTEMRERERERET